MTGHRVRLSGEFTAGIEFHIDTKQIDVNPHRLIQPLISHFEKLIRELHASGEASPIGRKFSQFFDQRM